MPQRIGIYSGAFNPVHIGHITFALQALRAAGLDRLYFLPERQPRHKKGVEHFGHRVGMLKQAIKPYKQFDVLELHDVNFTVNGTLPRLQKQFPGSQLIFLMGSDVARHVPQWPQAAKLLKESELVIGVRSGHDTDELKSLIEQWTVAPLAAIIFESFAPDVSSSEVREGLLRRQPQPGTLRSVQKYSNRHWLYVSVA